MEATTCAEGGCTGLNLYTSLVDGGGQGEGIWNAPNASGAFKPGDPGQYTYWERGKVYHNRRRGFAFGSVTVRCGPLREVEPERRVGGVSGYGQIQRAFWTHPDIRTVGPDAKLIAAYLLTGPHTNGLGCFYLPDGYMSADLGLSAERVSKGFGELFRKGFVKRCEATDYVFVPKFLKWNPITNANVAKARFRELEAVPSDFTYILDLVGECSRFGNHWQKGFETLHETLSNSDPIRSEHEPNLPEQSSCTELVASDPSVPAFITLPVVGNGLGEAEVTETMIAEWEQAYPGVDVRQQLRNMRQWCLSNPTKRKTAKGLRKFITGWLAKEQDKGGKAAPRSGGRESPRERHERMTAEGKI